MGRYYWDKKITVEECLDLDVFWLRKHGYLDGYKSGGIKWMSGWGHENSVSLQVEARALTCKISYSIGRDGEDKESIEQQVPLTTSVCNYGGSRYWFICPIYRNGHYCGKRVGKLFKYGGSKYFACRHCLDLSYDSRNLTRYGFTGFLCRTFDIERQIQKAEKNLTTRYYAGKPTRKYRRILKLEHELLSVLPNRM